MTAPESREDLDTALAEVLEVLRNAMPQLPPMPRLGNTPCAGRAPMWDDRVEGESSDDRIERLTAARNICRRCPVRLGCDAEAQASPYTEGMWAGFGYYDEFVDLDELWLATNLQPRTA